VIYIVNEILILGILFIFFALLAIGIPVSFTLFITGFAALTLTNGLTISIALLQSAFYSTITSYLITTVPLFVLMAFILNESGLVRDLFQFFNDWFGHFRGGLAFAATIANGGMAALSGSSSATAGAMSAIAVPQMREHGYDDRLSAGTVSAAGTFAILLPPSLALIIYGIMTQTSIATLFLAGIIPGMLTLGAYLAIIWAWGRYNPDVIGGQPSKVSMEQRISSLRRIWPASLLIIIVLGSLYTGIVTPTESGAMGAFGALVISVFIYDMDYREIYDAHVKTIELTTMVFLIVIAADVFSRWLTLQQVTQNVITGVINSGLSQLAVLILLLAIYVILGAFMEQLAILILTLPLTYPLVVETMGYSPIWFGIIIIKTIEIGLVTPPFGLNVYIATSTVDVDIEKAFAGAIRFLVADVLIIALLVAFPGLGQGF
jgi:tripartite ATP-independent transporter DctM subunit